MGAIKMLACPKFSCYLLQLTCVPNKAKRCRKREDGLMLITMNHTVIISPHPHTLLQKKVFAGEERKLLRVHNQVQQQFVSISTSSPCNRQVSDEPQRCENYIVMLKATHSARVASL